MKPTPDDACRRLAADQENLIHRDQARRCGMSAGAIDRRLGSRAWIAVLPKVYSLGAPTLSGTAKVRAASLWTGERSAISHGTAAALWQIGDLPPEPVAVTTERSLKPPPGLRVRRVASFGPADVTCLDGMSVTTPARTLLDLAGTAPAETVEAAMDDALRLGHVSLAKLRWFVQTYGGRGRAGTAAMKRLLAERRDEPAPAESRLERNLWNLIVRSGLPRRLRQHQIRDGRGFVARLDIAYPEVLLAVEADGYRWHSGRRAWSQDLARRNRLTSLGWRVLHVTYYDVKERPGEVVEQIRFALSDRTLSLQPRSATLAGQSSG